MKGKVSEMNMGSLKKWIIALVIFIFIIIILLVVVNVFSKKQETDTNSDTDFEKDVSHVKLTVDFEEVTNRNNFYAIRNIIGKYGYAILEEGKESLYNMLAPEYVEENNISSDTVLDYVDILGKEGLTEDQINNLEIDIDIEEMLYMDMTPNTATYYAKGSFAYNVNSTEIEFDLLVDIDSSNRTFCIYPSNYVKEYYLPLENIDASNKNVQRENIQKNSYNQFSFVNIEDVTIINDYLARFKDSIVKNATESYQMLDEEYKSQRFGTEEEYLKYIQENIREILSIRINKYLKNSYSDYTEYICIDTFGNYYIFKETAIMKYTILLDSYTINTEEFMQKYDSSKEQGKVALNIGKIVQAMNVHDYKYIYNRLDETFRNNNWASAEVFEQYMKEHFPLHYEVENVEYSNEGSTYVQKINLTDVTGKDKNVISLNIIMQLKENYEFVMSFSM